MNTTLGPYNLIGTLGRGGMGVVYKAFETSLNRFVAVKMLAEALVDDASVKERFLREARSMAALNDPHIIQIYFIGDDAGQTYFVMEFVDGESLSSLLKREGKLKPEQAAKIIFQTAMGLSTAHDKGVIHRDIKPGNLMITSRGSVKIADFGIALTTQDFSKKLTSTGEFVGTPGYLSPEVCLGKPVDQRSDIFSLGIVLFECLAGRMPFTDESPLGLMLEVVKAEIPDVCTLNAEVDPELSRILGRMIAKDPAERYQSCHELVEDLNKYPLVAKGGAIGLATAQGTLEPLRRAVAQSGSGTFSRASVPTLATPIPAALAPPAVRSRPARYWAAGAALALVVAASAWAFRADLPFTLPGLATSPVPPAPVVPAETTVAQANTPGSASDAGAMAVAGTAAPTEAAQAQPADAADPAMLDAMWLEDVPDDALAATDPASGEPRGAIGPDFGAYDVSGNPLNSYPSPLLVNASPPGFYAAPWRFGFGVGIGYWAARIGAPSPGFAGSLFAPGLRTGFGFSGATGVAVAPGHVFFHPAAPAAAGFLAHNVATPGVPLVERVRRAAVVAGTNFRAAANAHLVAHPAAVHAAVVRERNLPPHPKGERH
jgi:eukaryotic-like serine/threonine-protein kinase